ncbi:hypothetical protein [Brumimicrobium mesophilum]|uniref:hypothetical protein n=1 Tax=Brumimicrobium mesophilum TaxID=392717 RepID=UPI000D141516|nr:hypothetical protein [Brumimicrobium mesophilum]
MFRLFHINLLISISFLGYSQNEGGQISFVDSSGHEIENNQSYLVFNYNHKLDSIKLENLYGFPSSDVGRLYYYSEDSPKYNVSCRIEEIEIVDSIDINKDGFKEWIILRKWYCSVSPPEFRPYGVGTHQQNYSQYEVWDVHTKKSLFEIKNVSNGSVAVSTNVMKSYGYSFKVAIDKNGSFFLSDLTGNDNEIVMGTFSYDEKFGEYRKK